MSDNLVVKVPAVVELGSHEYEILFDEAHTGDKEFRGVFSSRMHKILLNPSLGHQQLRVTYIHEVVHAICDLGSVGAPEQDVAIIAEGIGELLFRGLGMDFDFSSVRTLERKEKDTE